MNSVIVPNGHALGDFLRRSRIPPRLRLSTRRLQIEQRIAHGYRLPRPRVRDREALAVGNDDRRDQALRTSRQHIQIKVQQRLTAAYARTRRHQHFETFAAKSNGIDSHVQEDLGAICRAQRDGVSRRRDGNDFAIAGRMQDALNRIYGNAIAEQALRKHRIGRLVERRTPAAQRRNQRQIRHARSCKD
ncbi:MAG TPA: hypothetical protein VL180_09100 [Burkholderiales bacterium]|nr:hypothetical protein [Burkholderiales bacterium]